MWVVCPGIATLRESARAQPSAVRAVVGTAVASATALSRASLFATQSPNTTHVHKLVHVCRSVYSCKPQPCCLLLRPWLPHHDRALVSQQKALQALLQGDTLSLKSGQNSKICKNTAVNVKEYKVKDVVRSRLQRLYHGSLYRRDSSVRFN